MSEFSITTEWIPHTKKEVLRILQKFRRHAENYIAFYNSFRTDEEKIDGCTVNLYEVDMDGTDENPVVKFHVYFNPSQDNAVTMMFSGYGMRDNYMLRDTVNNKILAESHSDTSKETEKWNKTLENFGVSGSTTLKELEDMNLSFAIEPLDIYKKWTGSISHIQIQYHPDPYIL